MPMNISERQTDEVTNGAYDGIDFASSAAGSWVEPEGRVLQIPCRIDRCTRLIRLRE